MMLVYGEDVVKGKEQVELAIEANGEIGCRDLLSGDQELGGGLGRLFLVVMSEINKQIEFEKLLEELEVRITQEGSVKCY